MLIYIYIYIMYRQVGNLSWIATGVDMLFDSNSELCMPVNIPLKFTMRYDTICVLLLTNRRYAMIRYVLFVFVYNTVHLLYDTI